MKFLPDEVYAVLDYDDVMAMKGLLSEVRVEEGRNSRGSGIVSFERRFPKD